MNIPQLGHRQYVILAVLVDGQPWANREICREIVWQGKNARVCASRMIAAMQRAGLVERYDAVRRRPGGSTYQHHVARITAAGRRAFAESLDFYLHVAQRFSQSDRETDVDQAIALKPLEPRPEDSVSDRFPTPAEDDRLLAEASPEFSRIYRFGRWSGAHFNQLIGLAIADVDLNADVLRLPPHPRGPNDVKLTDDLRRLITEAIGDRTTGLLFPSPRGRRWQSVNLTRTFIELRRRAGLSERLQLFGRLEKRDQQSKLSRIEQQRRIGRLQRQAAITATQDAAAIEE